MLIYLIFFAILFNIINTKLSKQMALKLNLAMLILIAPYLIIDPEENLFYKIIWVSVNLAIIAFCTASLVIVAKRMKGGYDPFADKDDKAGPYKKVKDDSKDQDPIDGHEQKDLDQQKD